MTKNWKTSALGISAIVGVVVKLLNGGQIDPEVDGPAIALAIGLLLAKDGNVTGGTVRQ